MDTRLRLWIFILFLFFPNVHGKPGTLKLCVVGNPKLKSTRTTKYCDLLGKSKHTPVTCVYGEDRLECLLAVSNRNADFSVFEPEDLYFSTLWEESSVLVVSEIRALKKKPFRHGIVAMVRKDSNITGLGELRGRRLCHPGPDSGPEWNRIYSEYFEERVAPANCEDGLPVYEDRIKTSSEFFGSACKAGPWTPNKEEDAVLKNKYWNLCALCEGGDCGSLDKYRGSGGSLICFKDGVGDVLWSKHENVQAHFKFLGGDSAEEKYEFLCDDGTTMPLATEEPCVWLAKPWQVLGANRKSANDVQKIVNVLSGDEHDDWEKNLLHVIELYLEYLQNLVVSRTPEDYLRTIPGYLSASVMSQGNCKPRRTVSLCVTSGIEEEKCDWMSKAGSALGIQPLLECILKDNFTACFESVSKNETDVISVPPDFFYDAAVKYKLQNFLLEVPAQFTDNYFLSIVVKKNSGLKKISDLKKKKICLTRKHGAGWWSLLSALSRDSLIESPCEPSDFFSELCYLSSEEGGSAETCCSESGEAGLRRCLKKGSCDAAILDFNSLQESLVDDGNSELEDIQFSDFQNICENSERTTNCHLSWSPPHVLMISADTSNSKRGEIFNVFFELGQYFGRNFHKNNQMLKIFGPFHKVRNVLFKDTSASFATSNHWNKSNNYLDTVDQMKVCSKSSPRSVPSSFILIVTFVFITLATDGTNIETI